MLVGCGESQQSAPATEAKPEPPQAKAPDISIHEAAEDGNIEAVKQHLAAGSDLNVKDVNGRTPLHFSAIEGHKDVAKILISAGVEVNAKDTTKWAPLHDAVVNSNMEIAKLLINNGASVNTRDSLGFTPLDLAFIKVNRTEEIADLLRKHGGKTGEELKAAGN